MGRLCGRDGRRADEQGPPGVEGDALAFDFGRGMAEAVVAHRPHAARQDVAQVAFDELRAFDGLDALGIAVGAVLPAEADMGVGDRNDARVADGGAADIAAEIFDDVFAAAEGLEMHAPVLLPDGGIDGGQRMLFGEVGEAIAEAGAEDAAQCGLGHEEVGILHGDHAARRIDARAGHDAVDVRVEMQPLVPGVEDHGEAAGFRAEPFGIGERVGKRGGCGGEEELIDLLCLRR